VSYSATSGVSRAVKIEEEETCGMHDGDKVGQGSILDQSIVFAFIRNSFRGLARPIPRPGAFYNLIELDRGGDSDSAVFFPLGN